MATPITTIRKRVLTDEEQQQQTIDELKKELAESNAALALQPICIPNVS